LPIFILHCPFLKTVLARVGDVNAKNAVAIEVRAIAGIKHLFVKFFNFIIELVTLLLKVTQVLAVVIHPL